MNKEQTPAKEVQITDPADAAPTPAATTAVAPVEVGAGGGQRVVVVDTSHLTPFQKIRFGVEKK